MSAIPRVFISATSRDLGSYRQAVAEVLLKVGAHPVVQEHFPPDHRSVVKMLRAKIKPCDAVICLVGRVYGQEPSKRQSRKPRRSYTQLEYEIAIELHKPVFVFIATDDCPFDHTADEPEELLRLQIEHVMRIKASDRTRMEFRAREHLTDQVRIMRFDPNRAAPPARWGAVVVALGIIGLAFALFSSPGRDAWRAAALTPADPKVAIDAEKLGREWRHAVATARPALSSEVPPPYLTIRKLEVRHYVKIGPNDRPVGLMGEKSFTASQEDAVTLAVELSEPAYCYLISYRPDGTEELCFPEEATIPPPLTDRPRYPWRDNGMSIGLDEGSGLQAFFTVVSRHRLPAYAEWRKSLGESPWRKTEAMPQVVWQYDGQDLKAATPDGPGETRGKGRTLQVGEVLGRTGDWLRGGPEIEAITGVGFHVGPPRGP